MLKEKSISMACAGSNPDICHHCKRL